MEKRQIKFRAWDKANQCMRYLDEIVLCARPMIGIVQGKMADSTIQTDEIMQFTGLLDKNGKEIYQGDILYLVDEMFSGPENFVVEYDKGYYKYFTGYPESKIIGNIYQTPDLLTKSNE